MSLVLVDEQVATNALLGQHAMDLLRLDEWDARIVCAVLDEERGANRVDVRDRRGIDEEVAIAFESSVLRLAEGATPRRCALEERDEVRDPDALHPRRPAFRLER